MRSMHMPTCCFQSADRKFGGERDPARGNRWAQVAVLRERQRTVLTRAPSASRRNTSTAF